MSSRLPPGIHRLQARIEALLAHGPVRARDATRLLIAEGWSDEQIREAKRRAVRVSGSSEARSRWHALAIPVRMQRRRPAVRREVAVERAEATTPPVLSFPLPVAVRSGRCGPHGFTTTRRVGGAWACWLCAEQGEHERSGNTAGGAG